MVDIKERGQALHEELALDIHGAEVLELLPRTGPLRRGHSTLALPRVITKLPTEDAPHEPEILTQIDDLEPVVQFLELPNDVRWGSPDLREIEHHLGLAREVAGGDLWSPGDTHATVR